MTTTDDDGLPTLKQLRASMRMTPDPAQRYPRHDDVVARAAELRLAGKGYEAIAKALNSEGWPTARGGRWSTSTVRSMLLVHAPAAVIRQERIKNAMVEEALDVLRAKKRESLSPEGQAFGAAMDAITDRMRPS